MKATSYELNNAGITLTDGKHRVQCSGAQSSAVKATIDKNGFAQCLINMLEETENGMWRQPTFKALC